MHGRNQIIDNTWYIKPSGIKSCVCAGGVVTRMEQGKICVGFVREDKSPFLFLPKGEVEEGETLEDTAVREILEETGIERLDLIKELKVQERLGLKKNVWKEIHYFLFLTHQKEAFPTDKFHRYELWWFPLDALPSFFWPEQKYLVEECRGEIEDLHAETD